MRTCGHWDLLALGLAAVVSAGCSSGGYAGDGAPGRPSDLSTAGDIPDLRIRLDAGPDLRRPLNDRVSFGAPKGYGVRQLPFFLLVRDLTGDGKPDVMTTGQDLSVLLGNGDGSFGDVIYAGATSASGLEAGDLNADGKPDVVLASSPNVQVLLGKGDGTFDMAPGVPVSDQAIAVALGDVNRDGKLDAAISEYTTSGDDYVYVLLGKGDGTFLPGVKVQSGANPHSVRLTDLNGDGNLDLATANYADASATVALGKGDGTFLASQRIATESGPIVVQTLDMNGDGWIDLVLNNSSNPSISLHLGRGDGTFHPAKAVAIPGERNAYGMACGDLNGDDVPDIAVCSANNGNQISVLLGRGDGSFIAGGAFQAGLDTFSIGLGDFNRDGLQDIAVSSATPPSQASILINTTASP